LLSFYNAITLVTPSYEHEKIIKKKIDCMLTPCPYFLLCCEKTNDDREKNSSPTNDNDDDPTDLAHC
jgi:hypothetical protein